MTTTIKVEGMMCVMCEKHVTEAVKKACNADSVVASHEAGAVVITSAAPIDAEAVMNAVNEAGYKALGIAE